MSVDIVTLAQVKTFLNKTQTTDDAELSQFITAASVMWNRKVGPVSGTPSFDERYDGGNPTISLRNIPVLTVTAVVESWGSTFSKTLTQNEPDSGSGSAYDYSIDLTSGLLTRRAMGVAVPFVAGIHNIHVTYTAGYSTAPDDVQHAILLLVAHMWETQRGRMVLPNQVQDDWNPAKGFMWPRRVLEIAQSYYVPGIG